MLKTIAKNKKKVDRVACPKFGHATWSSEFYNHALNTEFSAAVDMH